MNNNGRMGVIELPAFWERGLRRRTGLVHHCTSWLMEMTKYIELTFFFRPKLFTFHVLSLFWVNFSPPLQETQTQKKKQKLSATTHTK